MLCYLSFSVTRFFFLFPSFALAPPPPPPRPVESDNTLRIKNERTRSLLLFTNVTEKHFGNYTCFASNRLGASNASMLLFRKLSHRTTCTCMHTMARCTHECKTQTFTNISKLTFTCESLNRRDTVPQTLHMH